MIFPVVVSRRAAIAIALSAGLAGCAGLIGQTPRLPLTFGSPEIEVALKKSGAGDVFRLFWGDYMTRNWSTRFEREVFGQFPPQKDFYVRYHGRAWDVLTFQLVEVAEPDERGRVKTVVKARMRNPDEPDRERDVTLVDLWVQKEGVWMHVNTDPMLNSLRPIE